MTSRLRVLAYPKDGNPYQSLLYGSMPEVQVAFARRGTRGIGKALFPLVVTAYRLAGYQILHIHWPDFHLPRRLPLHLRLSSIWFVACLRVARFLGFRIVWTVHNILPHEQLTADDEAAARLLASVADAKIVHSSDTLRQMLTRGMDIGRSRVIPHGNYEGVYPDEVSRSEARRRLGVGHTEVVGLFFGNIRRYKGVEDLIEGFCGLPDANARLFIVGRPRAGDALAIARASADRRIESYSAWVDDADVALYFRACDFVCLPFRSLTTSGSAMLALTFGAPIVAPRMGSLADLPSEVGWFYDPSKGGALAASIAEAIRDPEGRRARALAAEKYAKTLGWDEIGRRTVSLFEHVLEAKAGGRR